MQNEDLDYAEVIRKGARIFLKPLVCFVNEKIQKEFGDDCIDICLLYTSPSPRDLSTSRMPSSA